MKCGRSFLRYFKSLIDSGTPDSSRSFSLVLSAIIGALIGITICVCLVYDTYKNGYIKTDLDSLAWFLLSVGCFMFGGGINEVLTDRNSRKYGNNNSTIKEDNSKKEENNCN